MFDLRCIELITDYNKAVLEEDFDRLKQIKEILYPPKLYRYRTFDPHWYSNIIKGKVYLNSPVNFNDPFDGNLYGYASIFYNGLLNANGELPPDDFKIMNTNGEIKNFTEILKKRQIGFKDCFRVACFSEKFDLMTMWAHYAANHSGYVIEYDTTKMTTKQKNKLYKIAYFSKEELKNVDFVPLRKPIFNLLQKDIEWAYEQEWRMVETRDADTYEDLTECISAIYLGIDFKKQHYQDELEAIQEHFFKTGAKLYEMDVSNAGDALKPKTLL